MKVKVITAGDAAYLLRYSVGGGRAWDDMLADMRRGRASIGGRILLPFCCCYEAGKLRPYYKLEDVKEFASFACSFMAPKGARGSIAVREVEMEPGDFRSWKVKALS